MEKCIYLGTCTLFFKVLIQGTFLYADVQYGTINEKVVLKCNSDLRWTDAIWRKGSVFLTIRSIIHPQFNNRLEVEEDEYNYNLHINNVMESDGGEYQCDIQNENETIYTKNVLLLLSFESTTRDKRWLPLTREEHTTNQNYSITSGDDNERQFPNIWVLASTITALAIFVSVSIGIIKCVIYKIRKRRRVHYGNRSDFKAHDTAMYELDWHIGGIDPRDKTNIAKS